MGGFPFYAGIPSSFPQDFVAVPPPDFAGGLLFSLGLLINFSLLHWLANLFLLESDLLNFHGQVRILSAGKGA